MTALHDKGEGSDFPSRSFSFRLAASDVVAYEVRTQTLDWRTKLLLIVFVGVAGLFVAALPASVPAWTWWLVAILLVAASVAAAVIYPNIQLRRRAAAYRLPTGDTVVAIGPDGVSEGADGRSRHVSYRAIKGVSEGPGHLFLTTFEGPVILPYRAFSSEAEFLATAEALREAVFRARPASAKPAGRSVG